MKRFIECLELNFIDGEDSEKYDSCNRYEVRDIYSDESIAIVNGNPFVLNNWKDCTIMSADNSNTTMFLYELKSVAATLSDLNRTLDNVYYDSEEYKLVVFLFSECTDTHTLQYQVHSKLQSDGTYKRIAVSQNDFCC